MGRLGPHQLSARKAETAKDGAHSDGGNLWLVVDGKSRRWTVRFTSPTTGKRREMGIGSYRDVSLIEAREAASNARRLLRDGLDPIRERDLGRASRRQSEATTFREVALRYVEDQRPGWRDPRLAGNWTSSLERLVFPLIGDKPVGEIATDDLVAVLRPIWSTINETADRVRGRTERILDYARTQGLRSGENPARWRGHLAHILPKPSAVSRTEHRSAVPWKEIGRVMAALSNSHGMGALAVRFACLTAARSREVREAPWSEIDLTAKVWVVPAGRMKMSREHRVPLSDGALQILAAVRPAAGKPSDFVFPGGRAHRPLSDVALSKALHAAAGTKAVTVHGLRSTFRDWVAETTDYPRDVAEMALAHAVGDRVEAAYRRGDLFEKRRAMMADWGRFAANPDERVAGL